MYRIINKALSLGIEPALQDARRTGKPRSIGDPARSYIIRSACTKPSDLGKSYEMWTNRSLTEYIKENAPEDYNLSNIANGTVSKILRKSRIRPYKITYYEEKTDPDFDIKEREILHVYKEVEIYRKNGSRNLVALLSYDEKPGIRVKTKEELKNRIDMYFDEVNKEPGEFIWEYKMDEMPGGINPQYSNRN